MKIDHILLFVGDEGSEVQEFNSFGLIPGRKVTHPGQGTSNTCYTFDNTYLELLWCSDRDEIESPTIRPTGMWRRSNWWKNNSCPFGFALRCTETEEQLPFPTMDYRPPYLPDSLDAIRFSTASNNTSEPMLFLMPDVMPTLKSDAHQLQTGLGFKEITGVDMILPSDFRNSEQLVAVADRGLINFQMGDSYHLILEIDHHRQQQQHNFQHPHLPLTLRW